MINNEKEIFDKIDKILYIRLYPALKKIYFLKHRERKIKTMDFKILSKEQKEKELKNFYLNYFKKKEHFYLSLLSLYAVKPLCEQEEKIQKFMSEEVTKIKVDYHVNDIDFSAEYGIGYTTDMQKEIEDCIYDLHSNSHIVDFYTPILDHAKSPPKPLTNARLKYSLYYLFGYEADYVTYLTTLLFNAKIITNPNTNGWEIDINLVEEIISLLNERYGEESILQYKRKYPKDNVNRDLHAITPINISNNYFPKNIDKTNEFKSIKFKSMSEKNDAINTYAFIFYITLSTQMKDSLYDKSKLTIQVKNRKLHQQANMLIPGHENWEKLAGKYIKKIKKSDRTEEQTIVLPKLKQGDIIKPMHVYKYKFNSRRPPRFGKGRFIEQILEKKNIAINEMQDFIMKQLIDSKAVTLINKEMLCPTDFTIEVIEWLKKYLPQFVDYEYLYELKNKISLVNEKRLSLSSIKEEIDALIDEAFAKADFTEEDKKPSVYKIRLVRKIAKANGININEDILSSNKKCDYFLSQYGKINDEKIGRCPKCNANVYKKEYFQSKTGEISYYYACENLNNGCNFSIWDNYIYNFFSSKSFELITQEDRLDVLKKILSKKRGYYFDNFIGKNGKSYGANIYLVEFVNKYNKLVWKFDLKFTRKKNND